MFTSDSVDKFVFDSFLHSQGDPPTQSLILKWAEVNYGIGYSDSLERMQKLTTRLMKYANSSSHNSPEDMTVEGTITEIEDPPEASEVLLLPNFIMYTDLRSTLHKRRPMRGIYQGRVSPSHVILFGMIGVTTGHTLYDKMYAEIFQNRTFADIRQSDDSEVLQLLVEAHVANNPADAIGSNMRT